MAEQSTSYAVIADSPDCLMTYLPSVVAHFGSVADAPLLHIALPCCGATRTYEKPGDIPGENVGPCECGNWFIYYRDKQETSP